MSYFNNEKGFSDNKQFETQETTTPSFGPPSPFPNPFGVRERDPLRSRGKAMEGPTPSSSLQGGKITERVSNKQSRSEPSIAGSGDRESRLGNPLLSSNFNVGERDRNSPFFPSPLGVRLPAPQRERGSEEKKVKEVVSITYEEIGLFPRSFSRVLDRFLKQVFSDVENLVIQEYRFYRYLFLTTLKCLLILFFVPFFVNFLAKTYVVRPLTEYFWNTKQSEIFLNSYQQKRAFSELKEFEEKTYFESLIFPKSALTPNMVTLAHKHALVPAPPFQREQEEEDSQSPFPFGVREQREQKEGEQKQTGVVPTGLTTATQKKAKESSFARFPSKASSETKAPPSPFPNPFGVRERPAMEALDVDGLSPKGLGKGDGGAKANSITEVQPKLAVEMENDAKIYPEAAHWPSIAYPLRGSRSLTPEGLGNGDLGPYEPRTANESVSEIFQPASSGEPENVNFREFAPRSFAPRSYSSTMVGSSQEENKVKTDLLINSYTMKSSLFVYQTQEASKNMQQRYQEKTIELAQRYNDQSIEAITNFFADLISLFTLLYLLYALEIQINITKSFLLEVFFGLDDSKKSLLILLITDLLVGYHSSNLWELFFEFLFHHYGLPDSQTGIFLLVATLPVLLDVLFKYLIFRHLNRSSPATVATYHAMIE